MPKRLKLCFVGWGAIAQRAATLLIQRNPETVEISAIAVRDSLKIRAAIPAGARIITQPNDLADIDADIVIEAAGRLSVAEWAEAALRKGARFLVSSTSAFCDEGLLDDLVTLARQYGGKIIIPPGALGGIDALTAASVTNLDDVHHTIIKPPAAWRATLAEKLVDLDSLKAETVFFTGSAREAAGKFPKNANAAIISAMAGVGLDKTRISLIADPAAARNEHRIQAVGEFGQLDVRIENNALAANPKSSEMTALNIVRSIEQQAATLIR